MELIFVICLGVWVRADAPLGQGSHQDTREGSLLSAYTMPVSHTTLHGGNSRELKNIWQTFCRVWICICLLYGSCEDN